MSVEEFVDRAGKLRLLWLHTLTVFVHHKSQIQAAKELDYDAKTVRSHIGKLEKIFSAPLIGHDDGPLFFDDCNLLLNASYPVLGRVSSIANPSKRDNNDQFVKLAYHLTVRDMYLYTKTLEVEVRGKVVVKFPASADIISKNIDRVEKAMGGGSLLEKGQRVIPTEHGKVVYDAFVDVLDQLANIETQGGKIERNLNEVGLKMKSGKSFIRALSEIGDVDPVVEIRNYYRFLSRGLEKQLNEARDAASHGMVGSETVPRLEELLASNRELDISLTQLAGVEPAVRRQLKFKELEKALEWIDEEWRLNGPVILVMMHFVEKGLLANP